MPVSNWESLKRNYPFHLATVKNLSSVNREMELFLMRVEFLKIITISDKNNIKPLPMPICHNNSKDFFLVSHKVTIYHLLITILTNLLLKIIRLGEGSSCPMKNMRPISNRNRERTCLSLARRCLRLEERQGREEGRGISMICKV